MKKQSKKYQLVLQFSHGGLDDYDALIALEDVLIAKLGSDLVDGHDCGSGEMNIFILTDFPDAALAKCLSILNEIQASEMKAAYRLLRGDDFTVLWPKNSKQEFTVK